MAKITREQIEKIKQLATKATRGPWDFDSIDNEDGEGRFKSYALLTKDFTAIADTANSEDMSIERDYADDTGYAAWDENGRRNMEYLAACSPEIMTTVCDLALKALGGARLICAVSPDGTPIPGKHSWDLDDEDEKAGWTVRPFRLIGDDE